jgi:hypothetical protein
VENFPEFVDSIAEVTLVEQDELVVTAAEVRHGVAYIVCIGTEASI